MRKSFLAAASLAIILPWSALAQNEGYYGGNYARMSYVRGDVYVQRAQDLGTEQGEVNFVVVAGDKIGTKEGRLEIQLGRSNYLRLDDYAQLDIVDLPSYESGLTKLHLLSGSFFMRIGSLDKEKNFEIHTPDASFYVLEKGLYRVDVSENGETAFGVYSGSAEAAGEKDSALVRDREQITTSNGGFISEPVSLYSRGDDFSDWNETRDALYARRLQRTYLPADYSDYEYELADNGRWIQEEPYGYVWVPAAAYSDWRPYYYGRWSWYPIIGWTWISHEPWGWCTSHYGRWGWRVGLGWYWIPRGRWAWGPAWVHWYRGNDYIGWCPLSYYNYPAVVINNVFHDHYPNSFFPHNSRTLTVVHRDQFQNRRITQVALSRTRVNQLGRISLKSMQPEFRPSVIRGGEIATKARSVLSREKLRSVEKSYTSGDKSVTSKGRKPDVIERSAAAGRPVDKTITRSAVKSDIYAESGSRIRKFPLRKGNDSPSFSGKSAPSRNFGSPLRRMETPSRNSGSQMRSLGSPSRSLRTPSRASSEFAAGPARGSSSSRSSAAGGRGRRRD